MRLTRPKSLSSMILIGLALVAVPLLVAIVRAAIHMDQLAGESETLVVRGMQAARNSQILMDEVINMERRARLYSRLDDPEMLVRFMESYSRFVVTLDRLGELSTDLEASKRLQAMQDDGAVILRTLHRQHQLAGDLDERQRDPCPIRGNVEGLRDEVVVEAGQGAPRRTRVQFGIEVLQEHAGAALVVQADERDGQFLRQGAVRHPAQAPAGDRVLPVRVLWYHDLEGDEATGFDFGDMQHVAQFVRLLNDEARPAQADLRVRRYGSATKSDVA